MLTLEESKEEKMHQKLLLLLLYATCSTRNIRSRTVAALNFCIPFPNHQHIGTHREMTGKDNICPTSHVKRTNNKKKVKVSAKTCHRPKGLGPNAYA